MKQTGRRSLVDGAAVVLAVLAWAIPVNYVTLSSAWGVLSLATTTLGALLATIVLARAGATPLFRHLIPLAVLIGIGTLVAGDVASVGFFFAPFLMGAGLTFASTRDTLYRILLVLLVAVTATLAIDYIARGTIVSEFFGTPLRSLVDLAGFRARGIVGQPVPAAMIAVSLGAVCWLLAEHNVSGRARLQGRILSAACVSGSLLMTGTRSAFLLTIVMVAIIVIRSVVRRSVRLSPLVMFAGILSAGGILAAWPSISTSLGNSRLFAFAELAGSDSVQGRLFSNEILERWATGCDLACIIAGSGPRSLQNDLGSSLGILGLTTVDNMYVTVLWDMGLIGGATLLAVAIIAIGCLLSRRADVVAIAGGIGIASVLLSGFVYDAIYTRPVLLLLGVFFAMTYRVRSQALDDARPSMLQTDAKVVRIGN